MEEFTVPSGRSQKDKIYADDYAFKKTWNCYE